ncbi:MAG: ATP-binding cassette domain-containing protein [Actinomycetota bacterium]|nr:ATP-binding cassette domain-containing protein [Actinomycetota bacterium]
MSPALALVAASVRTHGRDRLQPTTLEFAAGSVTAVIGRNGSGKSTLLSLLAWELHPSSGSVHVLGDDAASLGLVELARRRAILTQDSTVSFPFTVGEVVGWGRFPWRSTERAADDDAVIMASIEAQGLMDLVDRPVTALSGGERKRVHLARVLAQQTPILLLDEADSDLDLVGRRVIDDLVLDHSRRGDTTIVVSHDVDRMARVCDRFVLMREGRVHAAGPPDEVLRPGLLSETFGAQVVVERTGGHVSVHLPDAR